MRKRTLAASALAMATVGCQSWGPAWSEVTGLRYHRAIAERLPATLVSVGNQPVFMTPFMVAPGTYRVTVESPRHDGFPGTVRDFELRIEPCRRYYINAQFAGPLGPEWRPVIDEIEPISGCRVSS
jgi:hypothetical protein